MPCSLYVGVSNHAFFHTLIPKFQFKFSQKIFEVMDRIIKNLHCIDNT